MTDYCTGSSNYYSFLLRLRCVEAQGEAGVRISLEQVDGGRTLHFTSLEALVDYLQSLVRLPLPLPPGRDEGTAYDDGQFWKND